MAYIDLPAALPGILGPMVFRPETAKPMNELAEVLLRGESSLSRGERELIAPFVSRLNACTFCSESHGASARMQLDGGEATVEAVWADFATASISAKLKALLAIAAAVQRSGLQVTDALISRARRDGASDVELHDTVLIAAAFCMFNRYVDGLGTWAPQDRAAYDDMAPAIVEHGYVAAMSAAQSW